MKKFIFPKYLKYVSSVSEWSSSIYTFNKRNLFLLNNNEKKAYVLLYHYFSSNLLFNKATTNIKFIDFKSICTNYLNEYMLSKLLIKITKLNFFNIEKKTFFSFSDIKDINKNITNDRILLKKTWKLNRLLKYRSRRKIFFKSIKNSSVNKVYVSKPEIKYSIKDVIITVYIYNRERFYFLKKLSRLNNFFYFKLEKNKNWNKKNFLFKFKYLSYKQLYKQSLIIRFLHQRIEKKSIISNLIKYIPKNDNNEIDYSTYNNLHYKLIGSNKSILSYDNKFILSNIKKIFFMNLKQVYLSKFYIAIIYLNNYKFNNNNLVELKNKLYNIYKKKININIINLKYLYLENTIFLDALMNKLNDRKKKALKVIRKGLSLGKIVKLHPLFYRERDSEREMEKKNFDRQLNTVNDKLNNLLFMLNKNKYINILSRLKNKHVSGLRVEAKGRLTKRLTASRAVYKISYKGSLKNIYSSYNKLSTIILRGLSKSNTEYVNTNSKNRNGSYGVKYWISTY
jgi:hypothetical protein